MTTGGAGTYVEQRRDAETERAEHRGRERDAVGAAVLVALPLVTYALTRWGLSRLEAVGIAAFFAVLVVAWRRGASVADRDRVARWASGAWGEEATAAALQRIDGRSVTVFHDVVVDGRGGNIDHVVVGRGGPVVVESKRWKGKVVVGRHVRVDGEIRDDVIDQVARLRRSLSRRLDGVPVDAFVCVHARRIRPAWFRRRAEIEGVRFGGPDDLVRWLRRRRRTLTRGQTRALAERVAHLRLESRVQR